MEEGDNEETTSRHKDEEEEEDDEETEKRRNEENDKGAEEYSAQDEAWPRLQQKNMSWRRGSHVFGYAEAGVQCHGR